MMEDIVILDYYDHGAAVAPKTKAHMTITINKVSQAVDIEKCFDIRAKIFIEGQNVPIAEELDGKDDTAEHFLLSIDGRAIGTARVRLLKEKAKIERVAILNPYQGRGLGKELMEAILEDLKANPQISIAMLSAQSYVIPFYEKLGFIVCSEEYMDAGIPHKTMERQLK